MDYSEEYVDDGQQMDTEGTVVPDDWPANWPVEYVHHHISLADRLVKAQSERTPPKVKFISS